MSIADTTDFVILRMIVNNPECAYSVIKELGIAVEITDVIASPLKIRRAVLLKSSK